MNTILQTIKRDGVWLTEARTPSGELVRANSAKSRQDAEEKARRAEPEPA